MTPYQQYRRMHRRLHLASCIVPASSRQAWLAEWVAELIFAAGEGSEHDAILARGFLADAYTVRRLYTARRVAEVDWSAPHICLRILCIFFAALLLLCLTHGQVRHLLLSRWGHGAFSCFATLAVLSVPSAFVTSRMGAYEAYSGEAASMLQRWARWRFLAAKLTLCVLSSYLLAVQVTWLFQRPLGAQADWLLVGCGLVFNVVAVSWVFTDQRQRCPTCMRSLRGAARMGPPSWSLLDTSATEEMCDRGHGLLHQPVWQTSWFENARWLQLDSTWSGLFRN